MTGVPSGNQITLRQLAAMRSGLYNYTDDTNQDLPRQPFRQRAPRELLEIAGRHPLLFPPGSAFDYSNTNTVLLGMVVEKVSGQSLASFIEQNILQPVGLTRTVFPAGAEMPSPHARGYFKMPDGKVVDATDWNPSWGWASGNMISSLDDMRVWTRDFAMGKLLSPAMKRERDRFLPAPQEGDGALYGLAIENQNGWAGHNGNIMSYMAYPYYLPSERITMVVLLNSGVDVPGSWAMMQDITRIPATCGLAYRSSRSPHSLRRCMRTSERDRLAAPTRTSRHDQAPKNHLVSTLTGLGFHTIEPQFVRILWK